MRNILLLSTVLALAAPAARADLLQEMVNGAFAVFKPTNFMFSRRMWRVKLDEEPMGPGPNLFSRENVRVDAQGLHLRISKEDGRWHCAEVISEETFGYGTYRFTVETPSQNLAPNIVLGLFTWSDKPAFNHREIDVEFSRWGKFQNQNAQFVVQPQDSPEKTKRFDGPRGQSTVSFTWLPGQVTFENAPSGGVVETFPVSKGVPPSGDEKVHMNLWLYDEKATETSLPAPADGRPVEMIISRFEFIPAPLIKPAGTARSG